MQMIQGYNPTAWDTQTSAALSKVLSGQPSFNVDDQATAERFQRGVVTPMLYEYDQSVAPRLNEAYNTQGALFSSRLADAKTRSLSDMSVAQSGMLAQWQQQNQQLSAQLAESAAQRQMQGIPLAQAFASMPLERSMMMSQALQPFQQRLDQQSQSQYSEWLRTQPENSPWNQLAMQYIGTPQIALYGQQQQSPLSVGGLAGGLLGGALMGSQMGLGPMGMLGVASLGGVAGGFR